MIKVLIADDDSNVLNAIGRVLKANGYEVFCALNGRRCFNIMVEKKIDVLILDLSMPEVDGFTVFDFIRQSAEITEDSKVYEYLVRVPIIILSGFIDEKAREWFKGRNVVAYFTKPPDVTALIKKIEEVVAK
jgi:CheY-like chemotaxis protein